MQQVRWSQMHSQQIHIAWAISVRYTRIALKYLATLCTHHTTHKEILQWTIDNHDLVCLNRKSLRFSWIFFFFFILGFNGNLLSYFVSCTDNWLAWTWFYIILNAIIWIPCKTVSLFSPSRQHANGASRNNNMNHNQTENETVKRSCLLNRFSAYTFLFIFNSYRSLPIQL